jgi:hypothetical protein
LRFFFPSTASLGRAPCEAGCHLHLGSALRLSQPLSGFLAGSSFAALFRAATVPGIPPFRVFPSPEIAYPSRGSLAPLQLSTEVPGRATRFLVTGGFPYSHAFARSPGSPVSYGLPFRAPRCISRLPWVSCRGTVSFRQLHLLRSFTLSRESVRSWIEFPRTSRPILSWDLSPLELSPSTPRILDPPRPRA